MSATGNPRPSGWGGCQSVLAASVTAIEDAAAEFGDDGEVYGQPSVFARAVLEAAVPLLAEAWGVTGSAETEGLRMTREILDDPNALAEIRAAEKEIARGNVVRGTAAVRALRPRPNLDACPEVPDA
jgi:antitoxin YefM